MISNYLKVALRNLNRNKAYSFINILGFALGIACSLVILLWVQYQWSMNRFNTNLDRMYRVLRIQPVSDVINVFRAMPGPFGEDVKQDIPEIEEVAHYFSQERIVTLGKNSFIEQGVFMNPGGFAVYTFPVLAGDAKKALGEPNSIVLSESLAKKLFPSDEVNSLIGKTLRLDNTVDVSIQAVFKDIPKTSSLRFEFALSMQEYLKTHKWAQGYGNNAFSTTILLRQGASQASVDAKLKDFLQRKAKITDGQTLFTQPLADVYLFGKFVNGKQQGGRIETVRLFLVIALLVLLLACVNFMNLTTARGVRRSKEIGIRKVVGASRWALVVQVLSESVFTAVIAVPLALLLVEALLPLVKEITGFSLKIPYTEPIFWSLMFTASAFVGILAGLYPALSLSSYQMATTLKGVLKSGPAAVRLRQGLVIAEFVIAIVFMIATVVVYRQIEFIKSKNIGLDRNNVVALPAPASEERFRAMKQELLGHSEILSVSGSAFQLPISIGNNTTGVRWKGQAPSEKLLIAILNVHYEYLETLGMTLREGRGFQPEFPADSVSFIINESCARQMHFDKPIGETLRWGDEMAGPIIGVVKDFHFASMKENIEPLMMILTKNPEQMLVRFADGKSEVGLDILRKSFEKHQPENVFYYNFLDEEFDALYKSERMIGQLALVFAVVAIGICCLGLFGLAAFMAETRTKEIGVRKVLGASVSSIIGLLSKDFLKLVGVAVILATPLAYWGMQNWLQEYMFRTELSWWLFPLMGVVAASIAFVTVAGQSWRVAQQNPVKSLRSE